MASDNYNILDHSALERMLPSIGETYGDRMRGRILVQELLNDIKRERGELPADLHITRMCGALVAVSEGQVLKVTHTKMRYCPLASSLYDQMKHCEECGLESMKQDIAASVGSKILRFGHFTERRELMRCDIAIPFGASEMLMYALNKKGVDAAVTVCDGAGTVITEEPKLVQGIGARMNGIFHTSPVNDVIRTITQLQGCVLSPPTATIDQISGVRKAIQLGYKRIAVTINGFAGENLIDVRKLEKETGSSITVLVVCTTGLEKERAEEIERYADLVWSCASIHVRDTIGKKAIIQIGVKIPAFVLTQKGTTFVANYASPKFESNVEEGKKYVIMGHPREKLHNFKRIRMGNFDTYLGEIDQLPLRVDDEPRPLI